MHPFDIIMALLLWCGAGHAAYWYEYDGDPEAWLMTRICYKPWFTRVIYAICIIMGPAAWCLYGRPVLHDASRN